jgi:predicted dehydrogenase
MSGKLRIGALGNAKILRRFTQTPEVSAFGQIDVIATRSKESALVASEGYPNKKVLVGYEPVLELKDLDAVYVCLPAGLHYEWAKKALEAGKHVLVEKPAVLSAHEARTLDEIAVANKLVLMEAWWYRFHPLVQSLHQLVASNALGAIRHISSSFSYVNSDPNDSRWKAEMGGGALYDMFSYHIDFLNYVMGIRNQDVELIQAFSSSRHGVDASISAELITNKGVVCNFMAGLNRPSLCKTFILGEKGSIEIPHLRIMPEFNDISYTHYSNIGIQTIEFPASNAYSLMLDAFAMACLNKGESPVKPGDTIVNTELLERIKAARDE